MSDEFDYKSAQRGLVGPGELPNWPPELPKKKEKDCSAKHHKVQLLEEKLKDYKQREWYAGDAARKALEEYELWRSDPVNGLRYYQIYLKRMEEWGDCKSDTLDVGKKLHRAEREAFECEATKYAG